MTYRSPTNPINDADLDDPMFEAAERVHDWRNYVGDKTRAIWATFTTAQKRAIAADANEAAGGEDWD